MPVFSNLYISSCGAKSGVCDKECYTLIYIYISSCGVESGVCDKECYTLSVDEDTECQCSCLEKQVQFNF